MTKEQRRKALTGLLVAVALLCIGVWISRRGSRNEGYTVEEKLSDAVRVIRENYIGDLDEGAMVDAAVSAMVASLPDRWSYYLTSDEMAAYLSMQQNSYGGIGVILKNDEAGAAFLYRVYAQSPAGEAGLAPGSRILTVCGEDVRGMNVEETARQIDAAIAAGLVELTLSRPDGAEQTCSLVPGEVFIDPVEARTLDSGLGYIRILNFEDRSAMQAIDALEAQQAAGVPGIIFDVRGNPGGQRDQLLELLDVILPEGTLFIQQNADGSEQRFSSDSACVSLPMLVLMDENSYSAAEFFAAALSEYGWAKTAGGHTTGKGYGQMNFTLGDGSTLHISTIAYYTPKGVCLADAAGLAPELPIPVDEETLWAVYNNLLDYEDDQQLQAAEAAMLAQLGIIP